MFKAPCGTCKGTGYTEHRIAGWQLSREECDACHGTGSLPVMDEWNALEADRDHWKRRAEELAKAPVPSLDELIARNAAQYPEDVLVGVIGGLIGERTNLALVGDALQAALDALRAGAKRELALKREHGDGHSCRDCGHLILNWDGKWDCRYRCSRYPHRSDLWKPHPEAEGGDAT